MRWEHWPYTVPLRLRSLFRRRRVEQELDDELRDHLDAAIADHVRAGMDPAEARLTALRAMGGLERRKDECRDTRRVQVVEQLAQDLRYALRGFGRTPGFSAVAVLTLALGIGASTAILTIVNALLVRSLPFPDASQLVVLFASTPARGVFRDTTSFPDFEAWRTQTDAIESAAAWRIDPFGVIGGTGGSAPGDTVSPELVVGLRASHQLFTVLRTPPAIGRGFDAREQREERPVVLIGHDLWMRRFAGDPGVLGQTVLLNEQPRVVIGVLPREFRLPPSIAADVVVPMNENPSRGIGYLRGIARLKPGVELAAAQRELDAVAAGLARSYPDSNRGRGVNAMPLQDVAVGNVRTPLLVFMGAALFVLLIGCANVGNLVLARAIARQRELAVRRALGAGTARIVRQLLTESVAIALVAALFGTGLAVWGSRLLVVILQQRVPLPPVTIEWTFLAFAAGLALIAGLLCGIPPAFMVWRSDPNDALKQASRSQSPSRSQRRLRGLLVVAESALTVVLLVGAGLFLKSFLLLQQVDVGVNTRNVLTADLLLPRRYAEPVPRELYLRRVVDAIAAVPGVQQAAVHISSLFQGGGSGVAISVEGYPDPARDRGHGARFNIVSPDYFRAFGITIVRGRTFDRRDTPTSAPVAVISEALARHFWPGVDPTGKRLRLYYDRDSRRWASIIGVVRDVRGDGPLSEPERHVYLLHQQNPYQWTDDHQDPFASLVIRTAGEPAAMAHAVIASIHAVEKEQPVLNVETLEQGFSRTIAERWAYLMLLGIFGTIALVMAMAGLYGVISYEVARRTQEIGVRMAIGATRGRIVGLVLRQGLLLTFAGCALGVGGALALRTTIASALYGITATDVPTFVGVALLFALIAFVAAFLPARRAATIDPTVAFRYE